MHERPRAGLQAGWMIAAVPGGVVAIGPDVEVAVELDGDRTEGRELAETLATWDPNASSGAGSVAGRDLAELAGRLAELGALGPAPARPVDVPLANAVVAASKGAPPEGIVWTAEEALLLPPSLPARERTRALWAFVGGLRSDARLAAYALLAQGRGAVHGDLPGEELREVGILEMDRLDGEVAVIELAGGGRRWTVGREGVDGIGAGTAHRLGPVVWASPPEPVTDEEPDLHLCLAAVGATNLDAVTPIDDRLVQGVGSPEQARLIAHAEGAERHASAQASQAELVRASRDELPGAIDPGALYARGPEPGGSSEPGSDERPRLWAPVWARDGTRQWAPAETVYTSIVAPAEPSDVLPWSGSGMAAHGTLSAARARAFRELVERDAFMWTWIQRVSRERVAAGGVSPEAARRRQILADHGWTTTWVNLSLDTYPVILCGLTHDLHGLMLGAACNPDPGAALDRATVEALVLALRFHADGREPPAPTEVRTPRDHLLLHRDSARWADHGFLLAGPDEIELADIPDGDGHDLEDLLEAAGCPPLATELTLPSSAPFRVVRALAPGLLPLTFGWGTEPTGMNRARCAGTTRDGRRVGRQIDPEPECTIPHPFA
jgi:thiazole/oxazole-forming peptide maturase SagD family component